MNVSPKPGTANRLLGLVIITGFMLVISALPIGLILSLQDHYKFHSDWHWATILGATIAAATVIVGGLLLCTGELVAKRYKKTKAP